MSMDQSGESVSERVLLFSYGTLQFRAVQVANYGRELQGEPDRLPGYRRAMLTITDAAVIATSGTDQHPVVSRSADRDDAVDGTVFRITPAELLASDEYEVDDYARIEVTLASGRRAWVYVAAAEIGA